MTAQKGFIVHTEPVWRHRANFVINAELSEKDKPYRFEQLWARQLGGNSFEICCIPFFIYDLSLGDVVRTVAKGDRKYVVDQVVRPSGRHTFRIWFGHSSGSRNEIAAELSERGALIEWSSRNLLAVDVADAVRAQQIADYLAEREQADELTCEAGRTG